MRKRFEQQIPLGGLAIGELKINLKSRHELPPILLALQYVFTTPELNEEIFTILEAKVLKGKAVTGRQGMSLWEILVFGVVKLGLNIDYDFLHDLANNHEELRGILGQGRTDFKPGKEYHYQTLKDNVCLLDEETIQQINTIIVKGAHGLIKKKEEMEVLNLAIKSDSFVVESDIHFPTDLNLLWDCGRKCLDTIRNLQRLEVRPSGWRQLQKRYNKLRRLYRIVSEIHRKKGAKYRSRLVEATKAYLCYARFLAKELAVVFEACYHYIAEGNQSIPVVKGIKELRYYEQYLNQHIDLVHRRIILGEQIPHSEKVFSIFEPHVEWNSKGKAGKLVELGHNVLVASDQYHFILYHEVYEQQVDKTRTIAIGRGIAKYYGVAGYHLESISFDRSFFSFPAKKELSKIYDHVILPKPGKKSVATQQEESAEDYVNRAKKHSTVEANINQLERHGLGICRDKGIDGFKRCVAYGILSYNLHRMGNILRAMRQQKKPKQRLAA